MSDKVAFLSCRLDLETKKKLKKKAEELGLDLTEFIKKIGDEDFVFLDGNLKRLFNAINLEVKNV